MSQSDKEYADCALWLIQNIQYYNRSVETTDRAVKKNKDTLYNMDANSLGVNCELSASISTLSLIMKRTRK